MNITDVISKLERIKQEHGDLEVITETIPGEEFMEIDNIQVWNLDETHHIRRDIPKEKEALYAVIV